MKASRSLNQSFFKSEYPFSKYPLIFSFIFCPWSSYSFILPEFHRLNNNPFHKSSTSSMYFTNVFINLNFDNWKKKKHASKHGIAQEPTRGRQILMFIFSITVFWFIVMGRVNVCPLWWINYSDWQPVKGSMIEAQTCTRPRGDKKNSPVLCTVVVAYKCICLT